MIRFQVYIDTLEIEESGGWGSESVSIAYILDTATNERTDDLYVPNDFVQTHKALGNRWVRADTAYALLIAGELNGDAEDVDHAEIDRRKAELDFVPVDDHSYPSPVIGTLGPVGS